MAKGAYSVICYPEDLEKAGKTIDDVVVSARASGAEVAYILHDKDTYDEGDDAGKPKKKHYHICLGWEKGYPDWKDFVEWQKENFCSSPEKRKDGKKGRKFYEPTARVADVEELLKYFLHDGYD